VPKNECRSISQRALTRCVFRSSTTTRTVKGSLGARHRGESQLRPREAAVRAPHPSEDTGCAGLTLSILPRTILVKDYLLQVIGMGPAGLGVPIAADRLGALNWLLARGVVFVERQPDLVTHQRTQMPYVIESNSPAYQFLEHISRSRAFGSALRSTCALEIQSYGSSPIVLSRAGQFMAALVRCVTDLCAKHAASDALFNQCVTSMRIGSCGRITSYNEHGIPVARSRFAVLATGAREDTSELGRMGLVRPGSSVLPSSAILRGDVSELRARLETASCPIYIFGSSHSAFAAAQLICESMPELLNRGQITIVHKGVKLYYASAAEAAKHRPLDASDTIDPESGEINRFRGLRGKARALYEAVTTQSGHRVCLMDIGELQAALPLAEGLFIYAAGYRPCPMLITGSDFEPLPLAPIEKTRQVDAQCRVLLKDRSPIPNLFAIGIGNAQQTTEGVSRVGINTFHGPDGETITRQVLTSVLGRAVDRTIMEPDHNAEEVH
jgi:hypothetical protein